MKNHIKTDDLSASQLDAVLSILHCKAQDKATFHPTTDATQMNVLVEQCQVSVRYDYVYLFDDSDKADDGKRWYGETAKTGSNKYEDTALIAAARAIVLELYGSSVHVADTENA